MKPADFIFLGISVMLLGTLFVVSFYAALWAIGGLFVNTIVGCCVWEELDRRMNRRLFPWFASAPYEFFKIVALHLWPVFLIVYYRKARQANKCA